MAQVATLMTVLVDLTGHSELIKFPPMTLLSALQMVMSTWNAIIQFCLVLFIKKSDLVFLCAVSHFHFSNIQTHTQMQDSWSQHQSFEVLSHSSHHIKRRSHRVSHF